MKNETTRRDKQVPLLDQTDHKASSTFQLTDVDTTDHFENQNRVEHEDLVAKWDQKSPRSEHSAFQVLFRGPYIGDREDAAEYCRYNPFIKTGYRINYLSWKQTLWSFFQCHNETINIWSHFLGFWAALVAMIIVLLNYTSVAQVVQNTVNNHTLILSEGELQDISSFDCGYFHSQKHEFNLLLMSLKQAFSDQEPSLADQSEWDFEMLRAEVVTKWPLVAFLLTALFCLGFSTTCHLCFVRNEGVSDIVRYLDYWGIAMLFLGSSYPYISFKYACGPFIVWRYVFISVISVLTVVCMWTSMQKSYVTPEKRALLFSLFFLSCMIPFVLLFFWYDPLYALDPYPGDYKWPLLCYTTGIFFYIYRCPERWSTTGKFDYLGASHQIFHVLVLVGIASTFQANTKLFQERLEFVCPADPAISI